MKFIASLFTMFFWGLALWKILDYVNEFEYLDWLHPIFILVFGLIPMVSSWLISTYLEFTVGSFLLGFMRKHK